MTIAKPPHMTAFLPVKEKSERVPNKNFRIFEGRYLFEHMLATLSAARHVREVVVSTDSDWLLGYLRQEWPHVLPIKRSKVLAQGSTPMNLVIEDMLSKSSGEFFLQAHATSPLLRRETIDSAIEQFFEYWPAKTSLFSVTEKRERLWSVKGKPLNHDPQELLPTQQLEPFLVENSGIYIFQREVFSGAGNRISADPQLFPISQIEAMDIDDESDYVIAQAVARHLSTAER